VTDPVPLDPRVDLEAAQKMVDRYKNIIKNGWITKFDDAMVHSMAALVPALVTELGAARTEIERLGAVIKAQDSDADQVATDFGEREEWYSQRLETAEAALGAARARTDDLRLWIQEMRAVCQQEGSRLARHFLSELDALGAAVLGGEPE
jgi:hypothetical protein